MEPRPQITTHYMNSRESETRDMTDEEIADLPVELLSELNSQAEQIPE